LRKCKCMMCVHGRWSEDCHNCIAINHSKNLIKID
jgi:hypothetical protein